MHPARPRPCFAFIAAAATTLAAPSAHAGGVQTLQEVVVTGTVNGNPLIGTAESATEGTVSAQQLANRPLLRPAEVMEAVPGMIVTQHSGDGKANQYFLRGFNLDHGSDFSTHVMGMPVNMASHGHGQGYMDLNFLLPPLVRGVKYRKGVYATEDGDFATTGAARIDYVRSLPTPFAELELGPHRYSRALVAGSLEGNGLQWLGAAEAACNDGPWEQPESLRKRNAVLRLSSGAVGDGFALTMMAYDARWNATEHVPERAITSGEVGRYGALLPSDGGRTHRNSLSGEWARSSNGGDTRANAYVIDYGLNLFSSPSGFIKGPQGDQHEQADERIVWGGQFSRSQVMGPAWLDTEFTGGVQWRQDRIARVGLYDTVARERVSTVREDRITETAAALFVDARTQWTPWLRSTIGLRHDAMRLRVTPLAGAFNMSNGGIASDGHTNPKLSLVFGPFSGTELYANWGRGFHSNDARGVTAQTNPQDGSPSDKVPLLVVAKGAEIGMRATPLRGWSTSLSLWKLDLGSELVFIGDEGVTEPKGASRRHGLEWSNYITPNEWLVIDGDLALSQARFHEANADNGGRHVPNAIPLTASVGVSADDKGRWFGGVRLRYMGAYALEETAQQKSTPFWLVNLKLGFRFTPQVELSGSLLNAFDSKANDIEYWGGACTRGDGPGCNGGAGIDGRLVHPLEPRTLRLALRASF